MWEECRFVATLSFMRALSRLQVKYNQRESGIFSVHIQKLNEAQYTEDSKLSNTRQRILLKRKKNKWRYF